MRRVTSRAGAYALGPIIISFRAHSGGLSTRCSVSLQHARSEVVSHYRTRQPLLIPRSLVAIDLPPAPCVRAPADDDRPVAPAREPREIPRRAQPRRRAGRTPFDPKRASSAERSRESVSRSGDSEARRRARLLTGNNNDRPKRVRGRSLICPGVTSERRSEWRPATKRAGAALQRVR